MQCLAAAVGAGPALGVLRDRVPAAAYTRRPIALESPHWSAPVFEPAVVGFDPVVRVLLGVVERARQELVDHYAQRRGAVAVAFR